MTPGNYISGWSGLRQMGLSTQNRLVSVSQAQWNNARCPFCCGNVDRPPCRDVDDEMFVKVEDCRYVVGNVRMVDKYHKNQVWHR